MKDKQVRFCEEYLVDLNATQAAIRAGYSAKTAYSQGERLLKNVEINKRITIAQTKRSIKTELTAEWVLTRLKAISDRCIQAEPVYSTTGEETGEYRFDSTGANKATELIGKHIGMFTDKTEITGKDGEELVIKLIKA